MFIRVENGEVIGSPKELPKSYKNISGFNHLEETEEGRKKLKELGFFPYVDERPEFDSTTHRLEFLGYVKKENEDVYTSLYQIKSREEERLAELLEERKELLEKLKYNEALKNFDPEQGIPEVLR